MSPISLRDRLIRIEWTINIYDKNNKLIKEVDIQVPPLEKLKQIVIPKANDPDLDDGYELNEIQLNALNNYLQEKIIPNFEIYSYILVSAGIYDWDKK